MLLVWVCLLLFMILVWLLLPLVWILVLYLGICLLVLTGDWLLIVLFSSMLFVLDLLLLGYMIRLFGMFCLFGLFAFVWLTLVGCLDCCFYVLDFRFVELLGICFWVWVCLVDCWLLCCDLVCLFASLVISASWRVFVWGGLF